MAFADRVKTLREMRRLSQTQLADIANLAQGTISRIEKGQVRGLSIENLRRLADALGTSTDYLVGRTSTLDPDTLLHHDRDSQSILESYITLSAASRHELKSYITFLMIYELQEDFAKFESEVSKLNVSNEYKTSLINLVREGLRIPSRDPDNPIATAIQEFDRQSQQIDGEEWFKDLNAQLGRLVGELGVEHLQKVLLSLSRLLERTQLRERFHALLRDIELKGHNKGGNERWMK